MASKARIIFGYTAIAVMTMALLTGCDPSQEEIEAKAKFEKPETITIGTFDGCVVKYVDRGYLNRSFFLAKCDNTVATTGFKDMQSGKQRWTEQTLSITQEIDELDKKRADLERQKKRAEVLQRLTPEEREALSK